LSAAGLTRPGTFDLALMDGQFFLGLQLFSVLPGPLPPQRLLEELVAVGRDIASRLGGQVLDEVGRPLDAARIEALQRSLVTPQPESGE
jgi:FtsZ-interacting cell division protein ZipA